MIATITTGRQGIFVKMKCCTATKKNPLVPNKIIQMNPELVKAVTKWCKSCTSHMGNQNRKLVSV